MNHAIEEFASIFAFGRSDSSTEEGDLCYEIDGDGEYFEVWEAVQFLGLKYRELFWKTVLKLKKRLLKSKKKIMSYLLSRCMKLSENPTLFSFLAVCTFIDTFVFSICNERECFKVQKLASKCVIVVFHRRYVDVFDKENGFKGFVSYCRKLNATVLNPSKGIEFDPSEDYSDSLSEDYYHPLNEDYSDSGSEDYSDTDDSLDLEEFTPPDTDVMISQLKSFKKIKDSDIQLTDFENKLLYDLDELPLQIDPAEDIFIPIDCNFQPREIQNLDLVMQNMSIESNQVLERVKQRCPLCQDNCYKYVVFVAKELGICVK